ncbi:thiol reductant ABC exporter subunit CydC [candidate division KSB1 bacterium]|nr:thiol reductant ABC exporter subunit CydC [candidate division KSB1 bacterium]
MKRTDEQEGSLKRTFLHLVKLARPYKWQILLATCLGFLTVGSGVGLMMTSAYLIARAALRPSIAALQVAITGVRFFGISRGLFRYLERLVAHDVTFKLLAQLRVWFYRAIEPLAPAGLARYKSGDLLSRIMADIHTLENFYLRVFAPPAVAILTSILMWFLFGLFSWIFSVILLCSMLLAAVGLPLLTWALCRGMGTRLVQLESELSVLAVESLQGMAELLAFNQETAHIAQFARLNSELTGLQRRRARILAAHESLGGLLMNVAVLAIFFAAVPQVTVGWLDGVYLALLALGTMAAFEVMAPLPLAVVHLEESLAAAQRLFDITTEQVVVEPTAGPAVSSFDIAFRQVNFTYEPDEAKVLRNFDLDIPFGSKIVIHGPSGIGKTTIASLLMRFWAPQSGEIAIGGVPLEHFPRQVLSEMISYVPQNPYLFSATIRENLLLARPDATEDDLAAACQKAQIDDFVRALPDGFDTWIGEHGLRLSGGERQRLAMARGLLKEAPIYIFDEPVANVDEGRAEKMMQFLMGLEKTVILIMHDAAHATTAQQIEHDVWV